MTGAKGTGGDAAAKRSFDARMEDLGRLVAEIEGGALGLEDSMARYQQGMQLYKELKAEVEAHRKRFQELLADGTLAPGPGNAKDKPERAESP
jgi:exodeoxyribonuclease VII small subunit